MFVDLLRWLHVIGAAVLLGAGGGIAYFMLMAHRTRDPRLIAHVAGTVVLAGTFLTATAVLIQPLTGMLLAVKIGWSLAEGWLAIAMALYVLTGLFCLPLLSIQLRLRDLAQDAVAADLPLGPEYDRLFRIWLACGITAFAAVLAIIWLMLAKPSLSLW